MKQRAYNLMKRWCDRLLSFEIHLPDPNVDGGLICPACHVIHGRIADLVYPLTTLYVRENDEKYLTAAKRYVDFTERNLIRPDGSYRNDLGNTWKGTTAFSALALGETLLEFGDKIPENVRESWTKIFTRLSDFTLWYFETLTPNVNYFAGAAAELALAYKLLGREEYLDEANRWERYCHKHFDENGLFYGEIHGIDHVSPRGCRGIDLGYNLEESLPLLLRHAVLVGDRKKLDYYKARTLDHFDFLLPDGAIDNSFGTRQNKWTYWGSRTSDGLIEGLALVADDPVFARAAEKVLTLYEKCTSDDLLALPMAPDADEPTCLHHSFCHAKALAALVNSKIEIADPEGVRLPLESPCGIKSYQNGNLVTVSVGKFRATFSTIDITCYKGAENGCGSMTLLWHEDAGPVCASTMESYYPSEPLNMQYLRHADSSPCMTPRMIVGGRSSLLDKTATLEYSGDKTDALVRASGENWRVSYHFTGEKLEIDVKAGVCAKFILPVICAKTTKAASTANSLTAGNINLYSNLPIKADASKRIFNQVSGFNFIPVEINVNPGESLSVTVKISG